MHLILESHEAKVLEPGYVNPVFINNFNVVIQKKDDGTLRVLKHKHMFFSIGDQYIYRGDQLQEILNFVSGKCPEYTVEPALVIEVIGATCSGKTYTAERIAAFLRSHGALVTFDDDDKPEKTWATPDFLKGKAITVKTVQALKGKA